MEQSLKVLFLSSEVSPFSRSGIHGDVCAAIPRQLKKLGHDVRVITPRYQFIRDRKFGLRDVARLRSVSIDFNGAEQEFAVKSGFIPQSKVQVYFVEKPEYYDRDGIYSNPLDGKVYDDNAMRFSFLCHASLQLIVHLQWIPDIIHCNGWQTGLIPFLLSSGEMFQDKFAFSRLVMQVHQFEEFGLYDNGCAPGMQFENENRELIEWDGRFSLMKAGIQYSDSIIFSRSLDEAEKKQQLKQEFWMQFNGRKQDFKQFGASGKCLDWNPISDFTIEQSYSEVDFTQGKVANKRALQKEMRFRLLPDLPLGFVALDLSEPGQLDYLNNLREKHTTFDCQWVIADTSGKAIPKVFDSWRKNSRESINVVTEMNDLLYRKILAGCDFSLNIDGFETDWSEIVTHLNYGVIPYIIQLGDRGNDGGWWKEYPELDGEFFFRGSLDDVTALLKAITESFSTKDCWNGWVEQILRQRLDWENIVNHLLEIYQSSLSKPSCREKQHEVIED